MHFVRAVLSLFVLCCLVTPALAATREGERSPDGFWSREGAGRQPALRMRHGRLPRAFHTVRLDRDLVRERLRSAPIEAVTQIGIQTITTEAQRGATLTLPMPDGSFARLEIEESPIFSPELQAQHPDIRTYRGRGVDDPTMTARLDETPFGFHAMVISEKGITYIDPVVSAIPDTYISYWRRDVEGAPFRCVYTAEDEVVSLQKRLALPQTLANPSGTELRTYRMAVSATGEYTSFFGGTAGATAQIATTFNRVTGLYERDLAIRFTVTSTRIFTDAGTDPFTPGNIDDWRTQNQTTLDANPGSGNYDIGHTVSAGGTGGKACLGCVCSGGNKARGATSLGNPSGDAFDVDFVAHEVGHQMGGDHTFDGTVNSNCNDNRVASSAYEPGSGTTIMGYAGVCGADGNVQPNSDALFHARSFDQIKAIRDSAGCGTTAATGNSVPVVNAGPDFTIPQSTPFTLSGSATDANGDTLTYAWEQYDLGPGIGAPASTYSGPLFRSYLPSSSSSRTLPPFSSLISGTPQKWEVLPSVNRDLNFRLTARDNRANGGGSDYDSMVVHVAGAPFAVTNPVGGSSLQCGTPSTLTWNVGGGSGDANVQAQFSTDNAATFPTTIFASTPNDGSEGYTVPRSLTTQGWVLVKPLGNIYFSLKGAFSIIDTLDPTVSAPANLANIECTQCSPRGAIPSLGSATASDACDLSPTIANNAPSVFPLGTTVVEWSATDDRSNVGTDTQSVQVVDTTAPSLTAPPAVLAECTGPGGTPVPLGAASTSDVCWCSAVSLTNNAPTVFQLGTTTVTWTAEDGSGNTTTKTQNVTVQDTTPPTLALSVTPSALWPPTHRMITIRANIVTTDICDSSPTVRLLAITSDEADNGLGDGDTAADIQGAAIGTDDREFQVRAERDGRSDGRAYTIVYESRDDSGNFTIREATVTVPRNR